MRPRPALGCLLAGCLACAAPVMSRQRKGDHKYTCTLCWQYTAGAKERNHQRMRSSCPKTTWAESQTKCFISMITPSKAMSLYHKHIRTPNVHKSHLWTSNIIYKHIQMWVYLNEGLWKEYEYVGGWNCSSCWCSTHYPLGGFFAPRTNARPSNQRGQHQINTFFKRETHQRSVILFWC